MILKALDELRELAADVNSREIIDHLDVVGKFMLHVEWLESWHEAFDAACAEIEREVAERFMELPVDAGGEIIKPGDTLEYVDVENRKTIIGTVERICLDNGEVTIRFGNRPNAVFARESWKFLHVKPRTIEDVLLDAGVSRACVEDVAAELRELMGGGE